MTTRDVVEIRLSRVKAHLVTESAMALVDCGHAGSSRRIDRAIVAEGRSPADLLKLKINRMPIIDARRFPAPLRGDVELVVGEPIWFDSTMDHAAATTRLEAALAEL